MKCVDCGETVEYWQSHCKCGTLQGYPNRRKANEERTQLEQRYRSVQADAVKRGVDHHESKVHDIASRSRPVIAMGLDACDDILRSNKYHNYQQRVAFRQRSPATWDNHADREMVGEKLYPVFNRHLVYAALSPDGRGLSSYGAVAMRWQVRSFYIDRRASLMEDNSFTFFDQHKLGERGAKVPEGYQSVWEDRAMLAAIKLLPRLTVATPESSLEQLMMVAGTSKDVDDFIEIVIYAEDGLDTADVDRVTLLQRPATEDEILRWELVKESCRKRFPAIAIVE